MKHLPIQSVDILSVGYDAETQVLEVALKDGSIYRFVEVSNTVYTLFMSAQDKSAYFKANIMDKYWVQKL